ncbi:MAG: sigma-70 family RNA polymerase sigma factor [Verrucomicrobia bacterium]|nr:sigma-70 family RNA polymerase sigma factor [Verrucomicrobiota bacterium]
MTHLFLTTQWTRVLAARGDTPESRQALSELCAAYYGPVVAFVSRSTRNEEQACDLAHEFFATILSRQGLDGADPQRGRFRTYLLGAVKHFLANQRAAASCEKRGAQAVHEPIMPGTDTSPGREIPDPGALPADELFDREWALNVLDRALAVLEHDAVSAGTGSQFQSLKPWLTGDRPDLAQAEAARMLGMSEGAVRVAIYRLRRRFRELVKSEIGQTVDRMTTVDEELRHLIEVLSHPQSPGR